jgi:hypothetical protein
VGYTKTSSSIYPAVWATGRERDDAAGTVQAEIELKAGEAPYSAFDGSPYRWGDYTGMTADPDGLTFWYLGEFAPSDEPSSPIWSTYVRALEIGDCPVLAPAPLAFDLGPVEVTQTSGPQELVLFNLGNTNLELSAIAPADATRFSVDVSGGGDPCGSTTPTIAALDSCTVAITFHPDSQAIFASELQITSVDPSNSRNLPIGGIGYVPCPYSVNEVLSNGAPETGTVSLSACETIDVGPYELGAAGDLSLTAGLAVSFENGTEIAGDLAVEIDFFLALP